MLKPIPKVSFIHPRSHDRNTLMLYDKTDEGKDIWMRKLGERFYIFDHILGHKISEVER